MEIDVSLKQWNHLVAQLEESLKMLSQKERGLKAINQSMMGDFHSEEWTTVKKNIRKKEEMLHNQISHLWDMKIALEKVKRLYEGCENEIIVIGEGDKRRLRETLRVLDLEAWNLIPFKLTTEWE